MDSRIARAVTLIDQDATTGADALAAGANLSTSRFRHLFRVYTSTPLAGYLRQHRLATAEQLLQETPLSVKQVAAACGFGDVCHFVREFRKEFGLPPGAYRRTVRNNNE